MRRGAGVRGQVEQRRANARTRRGDGRHRAERRRRRHRDDAVPEFDPRLDLVAPVAGVIALAGAASFVGGDYALSLARLVVGALFLGAVTDAMLLGHWYLVQPGLGRDPIKELVKVGRGAVAVRGDRLADPHRHGRRC